MTIEIEIIYRAHHEHKMGLQPGPTELENRERLFPRTYIDGRIRALLASCGIRDGKFTVMYSTYQKLAGTRYLTVEKPDRRDGALAIRYCLKSDERVLSVSLLAREYMPGSEELFRRLLAQEASLNAQARQAHHAEQAERQSSAGKLRRQLDAITKKKGTRLQMIERLQGEIAGLEKEITALNAQLQRK